MRTDVDHADLDRELDGFNFPDTFDLGVSTSGYQVEGGFNGIDDPKNNWYWAEWKRHVEPTGDCCRFMEKYEEDLDRASWLGMNAFRMGIEWARLQPGVDPGLTEPQEFSKDAVRRYARIMAASYDRGMYPAVTLHHWTSPLWAGLELWEDWGKVRELFGAFVEYSVLEINRALVNDFNKPPIPYFITMNEPINMPMAGYLLGVFPIGKSGRGVARAMRVYENVLKAHILSYRILHRIYRENGWDRPTVTTNTWAAAVYPMDKMAHDLLLARRNGVPRSEVALYLKDQRKRFHAHIKNVPYLYGPQPVKRAVESGVDFLLFKQLGPDPMASVTDMLYEGDEPEAEDVVGFDLYDPFLANNLDLGADGHFGVRVKPWQWNINPGALGPIMEGYSWTAGDLPIHLLEQGLSYRHTGDKVHLRQDGAMRDKALKDMFLEMVRAIKNGANLQSFFYWSLMDNYEWGSFEPRFGLFSVDFKNGATRMNKDAAGINAAGAYRLLANAFRDKDVDALKEALRARTYPEYDG